MTERKHIGLGCPPRDEYILRLASLSPKAAWAELTGVSRAPITANCVGVFSSTDQKFADADLDLTILGADTFVEDVVFDIQVPSAFTGNVLQTLWQWFYNQTSGIAATLQVTGRPKYTVADNPTPLKNLLRFIGDKWPNGWLLYKDNSIHMRYVPQSPIPIAPVTITTTFNAWQYVASDIDNMPIGKVIDKLGALGYDIEFLKESYYAQQFR
jgi:hypothetical protein